MNPNDSQDLSRREFLQKASWLLGAAAGNSWANAGPLDPAVAARESSSAHDTPRVSIVSFPDDPLLGAAPVRWALQHLTDALIQRGGWVRQQDSLDQTREADLVIVATSHRGPLTNRWPRFSPSWLPTTTEAFVLRKPWPAMLRTIYKDPDRYVQTYWSKFPGMYFAGDSARKDEDGYYWVIGRVDDVIKVSGYRLGTAEVESALVSHPAVAEAAVIGLPHEIKGMAIHAYLILKAGQEPAETMVEELRHHVAHEMGPIAKPEKINFVTSLPKTRSGKIMRRVLKARALGLHEGDLSTLEE